MLTVLPKNEVSFEEESEHFNFSAAQNKKLAKIMGFGTKRIVHEETGVSDLAVFGMRHLIQEGTLKTQEIGAIILVTQTPDQFIPPTSNIIGSKFNIDEEVICLDINAGCAGYQIGLFQANLMANLLPNNKTIVLINGDVLSKRVSSQDRNSRPLVGDGVSITTLKHKSGSKWSTIIKMDCSGFDALEIPAGAWKHLSNDLTREIVKDQAGNSRSMEHLNMKGDLVFNFVQEKVPKIVYELMEFTDKTKEDIDYFLFHQPNKYMLKKLIENLEIPEEKLPYNIVEKFGNGSNITVPLNICYNLGEELLNRELDVFLGDLELALAGR